MSESTIEIMLSDQAIELTMHCYDFFLASPKIVATSFPVFMRSTSSLVQLSASRECFEEWGRLFCETRKLQALYFFALSSIVLGLDWPIAWNDL